MRFLTPLDLQALTCRPDWWALLADLIWEDGGVRSRAATGYLTDLGSVPRLFRCWLDRNGRSRRATVPHDWNYHSHYLSRRAADDLLRRGLIADGMSAWQARIWWLGVRIGGRSAYNAHPDGLTAADFISAAAYQAAGGSALAPPSAA